MIKSNTSHYNKLYLTTIEESLATHNHDSYTNETYEMKHYQERSLKLSSLSTSNHFNTHSLLKTYLLCVSMCNLV